MRRADRESAAVIGSFVLIALTLAAAVTGVVSMEPDRSAALSGRPASIVIAAPVAPSRPPVLLGPVLATQGYSLPAGVSVYAAEVISSGDDGLRRFEYWAGDGAYGNDAFWPASSLKLLVALGALDFVQSLGFTGAAVITSGDGWTRTVRDLAEAAVKDSSNEAYDMLVQVAGFDRLNTSFLSSGKGFPATVIQRSYSGIDIRSSPAMTITEGGRTRTVAARTSRVEYDCPGEGNCSSLFEMAHSVERVVLDADLSPGERLDLDPQDVRALTGNLQAAGPFMQPGVKRALGASAIVYGKPGWVSGADCVDVGVVEDVRAGRTYVLGVSSPDTGPGCDLIVEVAEQVLLAIEADNQRE